jgi:predicted SprT family Zn-dependent metalloprotease
MNDDDTLLALLNSAATEASPEPTGVRALAESLMGQHLPMEGPRRWTLVFDNAKTRAGQCRNRLREISLSAPLMSLWTEDQQRDTVLHEIAHALAGAAAGHGFKWKMTCIRIGADPSRTWGDNDELKIVGRYTGTCPAGHVITRHRLTKAMLEGRHSCITCSPRYDPRYPFTWTENGKPVQAP